ncbi:MAG TPA: hypothetical protein VML55_16470 [Planctomycetaceae bacterium]|nr:hypothetical protein [Planctomycetaceae bacterium]
MDLLLRLEGTALALFDRTSGERLLTESGAERQAREAERAEAAAEIKRLRRLLKDGGGED